MSLPFRVTAIHEVDVTGFQKREAMTFYIKLYDWIGVCKSEWNLCGTTNGVWAAFASPACCA